MTRNILDYSGNILGELTLPDETTEEQWITALSMYSKENLDSTKEKWKEIKAKQKQILDSSDWIIRRHLDQKKLTIAHTSISDELYIDWLNYRQTVRDIDKNIENPFEIIFPEEPNG